MNTPPVQESGKTARTPLAKGNEALRQGNYAQAITHYAQVTVQQPELAKSISANLTIARNKYRASRQTIEKPRVAVCGWDLAHNAAGRVYTLATIYETFAEVEIIGSLFPSFGREIWEPIRDTAIAKHTFVVEDESKFIEQAIQLVAAHPYDIVHLSKPRAPNIFFGILYKLLWGAKVLMDIDDEELAFVGAETPISIDDYIQQHGNLPELNNLAGKDWTRLAVGLAKEFDGLTVCNAALQQRYGGEIIRHARNEKFFKPSPELKRQSREKYGIPQDAKVVLFFGTPREHKGLIETAQAIASLKRPDVIYCIVGSFSDESFKQRLLEVKGCNYKFLPNQPIRKTPEILAIADCCVLLQNTNSTAAQYQTPAKLSDALGMGLPTLSNITALQFSDLSAVLQTEVNNLETKLSELLIDPIQLSKISNFCHNCFLETLTCQKAGDCLYDLVNNIKSTLNAKFGPAKFFSYIDGVPAELSGFGGYKFRKNTFTDLNGDRLNRISNLEYTESFNKNDLVESSNTSLKNELGTSKNPSFPRNRESRLLNLLGSRLRGSDEERVFRGAQLQRSTYRHKLEQSDATSIRGWCVNEQKPGEIFDVEVLLDGHFYLKVKNDDSRLDLKKKGVSEGLGGLYFTNPAIYLREGPHTISLILPDGSLSESIVVEATESDPKAINLGDKFPLREVTIIVPIYNAPDDVEVCIQRLLDYTPPFAKILLIDDCSSDERISKILARYADTKSIRIIRNDENLGFTRSVNRGITEAGEDDVVLLNSDARVTPGWLEGMLMAAYSAPRIATVTAMSDRAGAFSAPEMGNDNKLPEGVDEITYARAFRRRSLGLYPRVPTGNGFCMYVSRECINSIGSLDAQAFPRGYGEENDFCMRAWRAGWSNVIDDRTYVFHDRSKSFGDAKTELLAAGRAVVDERYPEYKIAIRVFSNCQKIALARNRARLAMQDCADAREKNWIPRVLFVIATQTGGTPQTNRDLMEALSGAFEGWILRCDSKMLELSSMSDDGTICVVRSRKLHEPVDSLTHNSPDYDKLVSSWLQEFDFDLVHIRHLGWHGLSLPRLARQLGKKVVYSFHDFYALSSTFKLIDDQGVFLGNTYLEEGSVYRESLWPKDALPTPHGNWLAYWRERFQAALEHCDAFVTTADSARQLILDALPRLPADRFVVIPHGRDFPKFHRIRKKPKQGEPVRILVPGHINAVKGLEIIRALIEHDKAGKLEFHILGRLIGEKPKKGVFTLGSYERHEFADKARKVHPHLSIIFSVWDETYCHTLTELWSVGLPVAVLDFPNVADRVRRSGAGWVLNHHNITKLYEEILRVAFDEREYEKTEQALADWQGGYGLANSTAEMAAGYLNIYSDVLREGNSKKQLLSPYSRKRIGVVCPASADLRHAAGSTHIRIWERTRNAVERNVTYIKMTPAMLIASAKERMLDGVIIQRTAIPLDMVENVIAVLAQSNIPYSIDLDDDLLDVPSDKDPHGSYASYAPALQLLIASAAAVTVSTSGLQEKMKEIHPSVVLLPNQLSDRLWRLAPQLRVMDNTVRALYMGTATHDNDLELVLPALDAVAQATPQFRLSLIGITTRKDLTDGRPWLEVLEVPAKDYVNFTKWLHNQKERFDFAIAPLRETSFNARKSDLKLLDYGALGLPVIASNINVYRTTNAPGVRLVENLVQSWDHALREQIGLGKENRTLGEQLRQWVLRERMLEKNLTAFDSFILGMISDQVTKPVERKKNKPSQTRIAVCVHVFYPHRWQLIASHLRNIKQKFDLFITCPIELISELGDIQQDYPKAMIIPVENRGMDVLPFLTVALEHELHRYDAVLKLHTKNDKAEIGDVLGRLALDGVLGTSELVDMVLNELLLNNDIGLIGSECLYRSAPKVMYENRPKVEKILNAISMKWPDEEWGFFAGTMFWIRGSLLTPLVSHYAEVVSEVYFETKITTTGGDGGWAHAMERVLGLLPLLKGKNVAVSYPTNEKSGHTRLRKVPPAKLNSKRAFHGFSVNDLSRYKNLSKWVEQCRNSDLFDEAYYREKADQVLPPDMDAATHFVLFGDIFGLNPSHKFSVTDYIQRHAGISNSKPSAPSLISFLNTNAEGCRCDKFSA
jgi:GT2 family glycosyltransferase/glycosyltransferase involved in cell wall biosynthesis